MVFLRCSSLLLLPRCSTRSRYINAIEAFRLPTRSFSTSHVVYSTTSSTSIPVFHDVPSFRKVRRQMFRDGRQVGFVPTMGALHEGHVSLVREALKENEDVIVSIFVNPTQFGVNEDLNKYPKTWDADMKLLQEVQAEFKDQNASIKGIFAPTVKVMYPTLPPSSEIDGEGSFVTITPLGKWLEGASRPVFFRGVATVCTKLFNVVQPDKVYFGQKDAQQSVLIKRMVQDFHIPTEVRVIPTSREHDGLALSSRNAYLGKRRRADVDILSRSLIAAQEKYNSGVTATKDIRQAAIDVFENEMKRSDGSYGKSCRLEIVYFAISRPDMSHIPDNIDPSEGAILSSAMLVSPVDDPCDEAEQNQIPVRLIDNVVLEPRPSN